MFFFLIKPSSLKIPVTSSLLKCIFYIFLLLSWLLLEVHIYKRSNGEGKKYWLAISAYRSPSNLGDCDYVHAANAGIKVARFLYLTSEKLQKKDPKPVMAITKDHCGRSREQKQSQDLELDPI